MTGRQDWWDACNRLGKIFADRFHDIRSDIDPDKIVEAAIASVTAVPPAPMGSMTVSTQDGPLEVDMSVMAELITQINKNHKERIIKLANSIGTVVNENPARTDIAEDIQGRFVGEDENHVFMNVENIVIRIEKDVALKILTLGSLP